MKKILTLLFLVSIASLVWSQEKTITGTILSEDSNEPLPGVSILIKGTTTGAITDVKGNFQIEAKESDVLVFSFIGYQSKEVTVGSQTNINLSMPPELLSLDEVVVVGYGTQKKSVVTGSIAKIDSEDLENTRDLRIEQSMQGRTAGVIIMNNSGQPGDNLTIRVRGTGTNGDPDPLFIIDGLPMEKEGLDFLNSSDVESIEVLKDASAAAIYGTRGANGVILITSKQGGENQKMTVTYDGYYSIQNPWRKLDMLDADQYIDIINEASQNDNNYDYFDQDMIDTLRWDTDWQDEMYYKNAPKTSHNFSVSGGSENSTYFSSLAYYSQDGIIAEGKSKFERINYRLNATRKIGRLKVGSNLNFINIKKKGIEGNSQYGTGISQALNMPSIIPVQFDDGEWAVPNNFNIGLQEITNPIALLSYHNRLERTNKVLGNVYADLNIIEGLTLRSNYGTEYAFVNISEYTPEYYLDATHLSTQNSAAKEVHKYIRWNWDNTLTFQKTINNHNLVAMAGITLFKEWDEQLRASKTDIIFDDLDHAYLNNSVNVDATASNYISEHTLGSYFGRINYNYAEKYLFEGVLRIDGSSRFGTANRYGYFPAFSGGWVISRENFFPENDVVSFAKLRISWGQNGNENIGDFKYTSIMQGDLRYFFGVNQTMYTGIQPDFYPNASIKWETSEQFDIGADLAFYSNRLSFTFDYYDKRTKDWLIDAPAMLTIGNNGPTVNGGAVKNTGFEIELGYKNRITSDLLLDIALTASTNKSEVLSINNVEGAFNGGQGSVGMNDILRAEEGEPLGYFYGYKTDGIFQTPDDVSAYVNADSNMIQRRARPGDFKFVDADTSGSIDDGDRVNIGNPYPKFITGLNIRLEWKGLDLSMFWYAATGHQIWIANRRNDLAYANFSTDILDRWHGESTSDEVPRVTLSDPNGTWKKPSDYFVKDADFLRLKTITLGYTIPSQITSLIRIERMRIYIASENLLTFTKYPGMEVEVGGGSPLDLGIDHGVYPFARTFTGGLNITF